MADNLRDLKRRIGSVKNTQKITKAMKLVAAAKFAKAQAAVKASKPYSKGLSDVAREVLGNLESVNLPLATPKNQIKKIVVGVVSTDRGLCGGINTNLFKKIDQFIANNQEQSIEVHVIAYGKKAISHCKKRHHVIQEHIGTSQSPDFDRAKKIVVQLKELYLGSKDLDAPYDAVYIAYQEFQSALSQIPTVKQVFPVAPDHHDEGEVAVSKEFIVEPNPQKLAEGLLERQVISQVFQTLLEAQASEQGSRMSAMDSATRNAGDVIKKLTLKYNRARQAAITKELIEIVSGAEAL